ncbi:saccharopine dehydrogenase family protein [Kordiimonas marina]|uniref:saccharopine dehydrogenase family protein n=1 Tax=Kordiimonas marina TaxID=2872312 RepID=UPI001FF3DD39|nr:saccharopine dehydrogenase NADP-binding domain-containing protein [Kordiimonas marina]MCJ9427706.1 saccharopine dehydrogenase NADP-binding domain-containing protein [Kordiimonas marina]
MGRKWMIYGATGYTGKLIAAEAARRGLKPTLAGRNADKVRAVAEPYGFDWTAFQVDDREAAEAALNGHDAVLSVAGPFSHTAKHMIDACLKSGCHYLDVTGEFAVFEHAASQDNAAKNAGIALIPGVGFDVVPSDCLAAHTAARVKNPVALRIAIDALSSMSQGTAKTGVETLGIGSLTREEGEYIARPMGDLRRTFDLGNGPKEFFTVSWGDIATAYYSTHIGNIEVYFPYSGEIKSMARLARLLAPLLRKPWFQNFLKRRIDKQPAGPSEEERAHTHSTLMAEVDGADGQTVRSRLTTPNGYSLTADSAVTCVEKLLAGDTLRGYHTPSTAFGAELIKDIKGCTLEDLPA